MMRRRGPSKASAFETTPLLHTVYVARRDVPGVLGVDVASVIGSARFSEVVSTKVLRGNKLPATAFPLLPHRAVTLRTWCEDDDRRAILAARLVGALSMAYVCLQNGIAPVLSLEGRARSGSAGGNEPLPLLPLQLNMVLKGVLEGLGLPVALTSRTGEATASAVGGGCVLSWDCVDVCASGGQAYIAVAKTVDGSFEPGRVARAILEGAPPLLQWRRTTTPDAPLLLLVGALQGGDARPRGPSIAAAQASESFLCYPFCALGDADQRCRAVVALASALQCYDHPVEAVLALLASEAEPTALAPTRPAWDAPAEDWLDFLESVIGWKTVLARRRALRLARELLDSVEAARGELGARPVLRAVEHDAVVALLRECGWPTEAAHDAARRLCSAVATLLERRAAAERPWSRRASAVSAPARAPPATRAPPPSTRAPAGAAPKPALSRKPAPSSAPRGAPPPPKKKKKKKKKGASASLDGWVEKKPRPPPPPPLPPPPPVAPTPWTCAKCTYHHADAEAAFLQCAMCGEKSA